MRYRLAGHRRLTIASALSFLLLLTPLLLTAGWEELSPFPVGATDGAVSFTIGDTAYVAGGVGNSRILAWDSASGWRVAAIFPDGHFRAWSFALVHDGVAIIGGGDSTGSFAVTDQVFEFNPATGAGFSDASLIFSREFFRVDLTEEISSVGEPMNYVERLDIE